MNKHTQKNKHTETTYNLFYDMRIHKYVREIIPNEGEINVKKPQRGTDWKFSVSNLKYKGQIIVLSNID